MGLLNAKALLFKEFLSVNIPKYAILSHTWGDGEVCFQEMEAWHMNAAEEPGRKLG